MSISTKLRHSGYWQSLEIATLVIVQFGYFAVMARLLDKADFGLMAIANSIILFGNIFAESGMGAAIIQKKDLTQRHINAALQGALITGLILFLLVFFLAPCIASLFGLTELKLVVMILSINFLFLSASSISIGLLHKNYLFKQSSLVSIISISVAYSIGIYLAFQGYGVWSLVYATLLHSGFKLIGYFVFAPISFTMELYLKEWIELFSFGFGIMLLRINNFMGNSGVNLVLGKILTIDLLGVFERIYQLKTLPSSHLGNILDKVMFPVMSEIQNEEEKLFKVYQHSLGLVNSILMPIAFYLVYFSEEIVFIMLGAEWSEAVLPLMIMFVVLPFSSSGRMADSVLRAKGLVYRNAWRKFIYVLILLSTTSYGASNFGIVGAAIGVTVSYLFNYIFMLFLVKWVFNKSITDIFVTPIVQGLKLTMALTIITIIFQFFLYSLTKSQIVTFLASSILLVLTLIVVIFKRPELLGTYIKITLDKFLD